MHDSRAGGGKPLSRPSFAALLAAGLILAALTTPVVAEDPRSGLDPDKPSSYFDAMPIQSRSTPVRELLDEIDETCTRIKASCEAGARLLELMFRGSYRDELPDFLVRLHGDEGERLSPGQPVLIFNRKNTPYLLGVQHLTVLVFSERPVDMRARLTTIREKQVNPFSGLLGVVGIDAGETSPTVDTEEEDRELRWSLLSSDQDPEPLYVGRARLPIRADIIARLTLIPKELKDVTFQSITGHLSNSRPSGAAFAVALGATFGVDDTRLGEETSDPAFNGYVMAKFYLPGRRPLIEVKPGKRSFYRRSTAVVFGTNVVSDTFEEIVLGLSFGHLVGKTGLLLAANWVTGLDGEREAKILAGLDVTF